MRNFKDLKGILFDLFQRTFPKSLTVIMDLMRILEGFKEDPFKETKRILERFLRILSMIFVRILKALIIILLLQGSLDKLVMRILPSC